jgi:hypothetical protein
MSTSTRSLDFAPARAASTARAEKRARSTDFVVRARKG